MSDGSQTDRMLTDKVLAAPSDPAVWADVDPVLPEVPALPKRIDVDPQAVERGLVRLVLTVVELIRQLLERQAVRRVETGRLDDAEIERLGLALMRLEQRMQELKSTFGLSDADLRVDLGTVDDLRAPGRSE